MFYAMTRRSFIRAASASAAAAAAFKPGNPVAPDEPPVVFWAGDGLQPNDVVMLLGGGLAAVERIQFWKLSDGPRGLPGDDSIITPHDVISIDALQPSESSVKFRLPRMVAQGVYGVKPASGSAMLLNRPLLWFVQPTTLLPGLADNEAAAGVEVQIIGKDLLLPDGSGSSQLAIRSAGGTWQILHATSADRYSVVVKLPAGLQPGAYVMSAHNGSGGPSAWSKPLAFKVVVPEVWPARQWNVREHGAMGDGVHDDTDAIRTVLEEAGKNGGGTVYFPWGTYRMSGYIVLPPQVTLRGQERDATILMWPVPMATKTADFEKAAIYTSSRFAIEDLTVIARNFDTTLLDLSYENVHPGTAVKEVLRHSRPWSQYRDTFLRRVRFQQWLDAGRPAVTADVALTKRFYDTDSCFNFRMNNCVNFEVSDCVFQGGSNMFMGLMNGRVTNNSFSNEMNYCWTVLGGGARRLVCTGNEIRASSSFGFGSISLQYVYAAHNVTHNFVRGEREGMTLDVSSMPSLRAPAEYWGAPTALTNEPGNVTLTFPQAAAAPNSDGFRTGFVPGSFRGGSAVLHGFNGGAGAGQRRLILENTENTVVLDRPWDTPPEAGPRSLYLELIPRKSENAGITTAWVGDIAEITADSIRAAPANKWVPGEFIGAAVMVFTGKGAGQYRIVTANTEDEVTLDRPWDVRPQRGEAIGIWAMVRHFIFYKCEGYDTSDFGQLYGAGYDFVMDTCSIQRSQGNWAQMGWLVQMKNIRSDFGMSYHKGIGPRGPSPESTAPYALVGLNGGSLRLTKFGQVQYPEIPRGTAIFVDKLLGRPIPGGRGIVLRRNHLAWNQRLVLGDSTNKTSPPRFIDAVIDGNVVEHSAVGVQIGSDAERVVLSSNTFLDVKEPFVTARPAACLQLAEQRQPGP